MLRNQKTPKFWKKLKFFILKGKREGLYWIMSSNSKMEVPGLVVVLGNTQIPYPPICTTVLLNQTKPRTFLKGRWKIGLEKQRSPGGEDGAHEEVMVCRVESYDPIWAGNCQPLQEFCDIKNPIVSLPSLWVKHVRTRGPLGVHADVPIVSLSLFLMP